MTADEKAEYKRLSHKKKEEFRTKWCQMNAARWLRKIETVDSWKKVDFSRGQYRSLNAIAQLEGGLKEDFAAATLLAAKCVAMGFPWVRWNSMTERVDYLWFEHGMAEELSSCWNMYRQQSGVDAGNSAASSSTEGPSPGGVVATTGKPAKAEDPKPAAANSAGQDKAGGNCGNAGGNGGSKDAGMSGGKGSGGTKSKGKGDAAQDDPKLKKQRLENAASAKSVAAMVKTRAAYQAAVSQATSLLRCIDNDGDWQWANAASVRGGLEAGLKNLEVSLDTFGIQVTTMQLDFIKRTHAEGLKQKCDTFVAKVGPLVAALNVESKRLTGMQAARRAS